MTGLKFSQRKDGTLEVRGLGIPFGGPINGKDLHGQYFSAKTDFAWDLIPDGARPLLYQHGLDETVKTEVVGRWGVEKVDAKGVWVRAQLSARSSYLSEIKELLTEDALGLSSATMGHLVKVNQKNGEILNWPVVELSLTPNPANPTAYVVKSMATPARHAAKLLRVLKHGDHDQSEHGNRDGATGGGSDSSDSGRSQEAVIDQARTYVADAYSRAEAEARPSVTLAQETYDFHEKGGTMSATQLSYGHSFVLAVADIQQRLSESRPVSVGQLQRDRAYFEKKQDTMARMMDRLQDTPMGDDLRGVASEISDRVTEVLDWHADLEAAFEGETFSKSRKSYKAELYDENILEDDAEEGAPEEEANEESDTLEASIAKLVESTEYTLGEIAETLAKATDENNEVIVNCLTESQDALEKLAGELATYLEGTSPTDEVEDETETETPIASPMASLAVLAGKPSRAEGNLAAVKAALSAEIRKQTLVAIGRTRDRK
jgi:hypothetical protein